MARAAVNTFHRASNGRGCGHLTERFSFAASIGGVKRPVPPSSLPLPRLPLAYYLSLRVPHAAYLRLASLSDSHYGSWFNGLGCPPA